MKITSGMWLPRYWIAASALSALSTPISYFSRMRARNRRADLESSTINARLAAMPPPDGRLLESVTQNGWPAIAVALRRRRRRHSVLEKHVAHGFGWGDQRLHVVAL